MAARLGLPFTLLLSLFLFCSLPLPSLRSSIVANAASVSTTAASEVSNDDSGSVLQALLESHYSEWMELVERAQMLHPLEQLVGSGDKLTIFAPQNHQMQPDIKAFLLKPPNAHLLKKMVQFHVLPRRVTVSQWRSTSMKSLSGDSVTLRSETTDGNVKLFVGEAEIVAPEIIACGDGVVHGVDQIILPMSVQQAYVAFTTRHLATPLPTGAPALDTRRIILAGEREPLNTAARVVKAKIPVAAAPAPSIVTAPSPFLAPAPAPGPALGPSSAPYFFGFGFGEKEVTTFVMALTSFGGYSEFAGLLVDLTSVGSEISRMINMGNRLTVLAPDDNAWKEANLTPDQLSSPTELEHILRYHILTEYQTEESLYTTLRRRGKTSFNTMHEQLALSAHEMDGLVVFGENDMHCGVFDRDIYADGMISVQGVDKVLIPPKETEPTKSTDSKYPRSVLEMLQLPSRNSIVGPSGHRRTVAIVAPFAALGSFVFIAVVVVKILLV
ncbi:unnamed protein product [Calypogeia fissa]